MWEFGFHSVKNVCKALFSFALFIAVCAGVVWGLVTSSNAKAARGGHGFGVSWSLSDRGKYYILGLVNNLSEIFFIMTNLFIFQYMIII